MKQIDCYDIYADARHYDCINARFDEDISFYKQLLRDNTGPVLECACGTGRITIPLAADGHEIIGIDVSGPMVRHAHQKAVKAGLQAHFVRADIRDFSFNCHFTTIFIPFNSLCHLHDHESISRFLRCVHDHLHEEGRFIIDVFVPNFGYLTRDPHQFFPVSRFEDPDGKRTIIVTETSSYDQSTQINHIIWYFQPEDGPVLQAIELNMRMFFPQELDALLIDNGFVIEEKFGSYDMQAFDRTSSKQLLFCRKSIG